MEERVWLCSRVLSCLKVGNMLHIHPSIQPSIKSKSLFHPLIHPIIIVLLTPRLFSARRCLSACLLACFSAYFARALQTRKKKKKSYIVRDHRIRRERWVEREKTLGTNLSGKGKKQALIIYRSPMTEDFFLSPPNLTVAWRQVMGVPSALTTSALTLYVP